MDFVQICRLRSFSDGVHLESVGEGKVLHWVHFGCTLGALWMHSGHTLDALWIHSGRTLSALCMHSGCTLTFCAER
jgi:hypothetical protein